MNEHIKVEGLEELNPENFGGMCSREIASFNREAIDFEKGIETIATTDAPALVVDWERWEMIREILPMRYCEMPNNDKVPLLDTHTRFSINQIKGSAKDWTKNDNQLLCKAYVSKSEPDVREKIKEHHIDSVSIGYRTRKENTVVIPKDREVVIDGVSYRNDFPDNVPLVVRTWWKVHELSLVPIGADEAAKFKSADPTMKSLLEQVMKQGKAIEDLTETINADKEKPKQGLKSKGLYERRLKRITADIENY